MNTADREWLDQRGLNVIGHELRTPVTTVRGLAEMLAAGVAADQRPRIEEALLRNARRLEALVDDLLAVREIGTALPAGPIDSVDLVDAVRTAWADLAVTGAGAARARRPSVDRILAAVLGNAMSYGDGPPAVTVEISGPNVTVTVDSPGAQLGDEDIRFAVEPFWRGERAVTTQPGLGLGLSVASVLAAHEGGRLWVTARPGGGMITFVELPAA